MADQESLDKVDSWLCEIEDELENDEIDTEEIQARIDEIRDELGVEVEDEDDEEEIEV